MANTRIPQLPPVIGLDGSEEMEVAQSDGFGGYVSRRTTTGAIANLANSDVSGGTTIIVTTAGPFTIADDVGALILNKSAPSATAITLGSVDDRAGLDFVISDVGNNAGDIVITPAAGETIMGFATYTIGSGGAATFKPNIALGGWFKAN